MKKILLFITLLFSSQAAFADCSLNDIGLGKSYSEMKTKYKLNNDFVGTNKYYKNIRGNKLCPTLEGAEVSILFLQDKIAQIQIYKRSGQTVLMDAAFNSFGTPEKLPNKDDPELRSYSTFWANDKNVAAYSFGFSDGIFTEKLSMQNKDLSDEFIKFATTDENKKGDE